MAKQQNFLAFLILISTILIAINASALPSVSIQPADGKDVIDIFPFEQATYELGILNNEDKEYKNFNVELSVEQGIVVLTEKGEERTAKFNFDSIQAKQSLRQEFTIKPVDASPKNYSITATYGLDKFTHSVSTFVNVKQNPIELKARVSKNSFNPNEEGTIFVDFSNATSNYLKDISVELSLPEDFEQLSEKFELAELNPKQATLNKEFKFSVPKKEGKYDVVLRLVYSDENAFHQMEKTIPVEVRDTGKLLTMAIGTVILIVIAYLILTRLKPKEENEPFMPKKESMFHAEENVMKPGKGNGHGEEGHEEHGEGNH